MQFLEGISLNDFLEPADKQATYVRFIDIRTDFTYVELDNITKHSSLYLLRFMAEPIKPTDTYTVPSLDSDNPNNKAVFDKFIKFKSLIGHCVHNAELLKNITLEANVSLFSKTRNNKEIMQEYFMELKTNFCNYLKKSGIDEYKKI